VRRPVFNVSALQSLAPWTRLARKGDCACLRKPGCWDLRRRYTRLLWGVAVDIGTTTIVGYLCDLTSGRIAAVDASLNGQQIHGADVITRIDYALHEPRGLEYLRELVLATLNGILGRLCARQGLSSQAIYNLVTVGTPP